MSRYMIAVWRTTLVRPLGGGRLCADLVRGYGFQHGMGRHLQGTATYRERIALPADAVFEAELQEISRADAPVVVLGRSTLAPSGSRHSGSRLSTTMPPCNRATATPSARPSGTRDGCCSLPIGSTRCSTAANAPLHIQMVSVRGGRQPGSMTDGLGVLPASYEGELTGESRKPRCVARGPAARRALPTAHDPRRPA